MSQASYIGLVEFINAQSADRTVDHTLGWSSCAVGDYMKSIGGYRSAAGEVAKDLLWTSLTPAEQERFALLLDHQRWVFDAYDQPLPLMVVLNDPHEAEGRGISVGTYGDLQALVKERFPCSLTD